MRWYDKNPYGSNPSLYQEAKWGMHSFARSAFASSFAKRGFASTAFGLTAKDRFWSTLKGPLQEGSREHIRNLEYMSKKLPNDPNIANALKRVKGNRNYIGNLASRGSALTHIGIPLALTALPAFVTPGGAKEKARATVGGAVSTLGWMAGAKLGAAVGSAALPVIGTAIGGLVGGLAGAIGVEEGFNTLSRIPDQLVERESSRRNLDWINNPAAFNTQNAYTMRQQSLALMNRGMNTARSALGREALIFHR